MKLFLTFCLLFFTSTVLGYEAKDLVGKNLIFKIGSDTLRLNLYKTGDLKANVYDKIIKYHYIESKEDGPPPHIFYEILVNKKVVKQIVLTFDQFNGNFLYIQRGDENPNWTPTIVDEFEINEIEHNENMVLLTLKYLFQYGKNLDNSINRINEVCILEKYLSLKPNQKKDFIHIIYNSPLKEDQRALNEYFDNLENFNEEYVEEFFEPFDDCFS